MNELRFAINLLPDLTVVTRDGEFIGTWDTDETDAFYEFTPDVRLSPCLWTRTAVRSVRKSSAGSRQDRPQ